MNRKTDPGQQPLRMLHDVIARVKFEERSITDDEMRSRRITAEMSPDELARLLGLLRDIGRDDVADHIERTALLLNNADAEAELDEDEPQRLAAEGGK